MKKGGIVLVGIAIILGAWWFLSKKNVTPSVSENLFTPNPVIYEPPVDNKPSPIDFTGVEVNTTNWLEYTNPEGGYILKYPPDWKVENTTELLTPEYPYHDSISIHADLNLPLSKNFRSVGIYCCTAPKTLDSLKKEHNDTSLDEISTQELNINGNKILILNTGPKDNAGFVAIYVIADNKTYEFNVMQPDVYNEEAYRAAVGIIRNFKVIK